MTFDEAMIHTLARSIDELEIEVSRLRAIGESKTKWIPLSERLPDIDEEVLVDDGSDMFVAWWVDDGFESKWHSFDGRYDTNTPILAWMPLPEPYKESEGKE